MRVTQLNVTRAAPVKALSARPPDHDLAELCAVLDGLRRAFAARVVAALICVRVPAIETITVAATVLLVGLRVENVPMAGTRTQSALPTTRAANARRKPIQYCTKLGKVMVGKSALNAFTGKAALVDVQLRGRALRPHYAFL